jgi:hypothetical protein
MSGGFTLVLVRKPPSKEPAMSHAYQIRRGDTYDYDCSRTSARLSATWSILKLWGIEREIVHSAACVDRKQIPAGSSFYRGCDDGCRAKPLPEWVTDEMINQAYDLADTFQAARGRFHCRAAEQAHDAR